MTLHIFRATGQPATRFTNPHLNEPGKRKHWYRYSPRTQFWCWKCDRRRWAKSLVVHVYYDSTRFYCRKGHGCLK